MNMALKMNANSPKTADISENDGDSTMTESEPWEDISDTDDPTFLPDRLKNRRTLDWVLNESYQPLEKENSLKTSEIRRYATRQAVLQEDFRDDQLEEQNTSSNINFSDSTTIISSSSFAITEHEEDSSSNVAYREKTFEDVANEMLYDFPIHNISPSGSPTFPYIVQTSKGKIILPNTSKAIVDNYEVEQKNDSPDIESLSGSSIIPPFKQTMTTKNYVASDEDSSNNNDIQHDSFTGDSINKENNPSYLEKEKVENVHTDSLAACAQMKSATNSDRNLITRYIEESLNKTKKKRTICKFCRISVTNFERHLCRHHQDEKEVQDYMKFPKNTKEGKKMRRNILALMRYEMDFEHYVHDDNPVSDKLPCAHCKRLIAVKYLRRHYKKCIIKPINESGQNVRHLAASQTLVACASEHSNITTTLRVKNEVFSRMAADDIGFLARKDPLIRHFGEYYLKKHKRAQISIACSNKMRECARLLQEIRRRIGKQTFSFFEILNPILFDDVVLSAKAISGYDAEKKNYKAPSLALHLGTTLQQICELTVHLLLKKSPQFKCDNLEYRLKEIKRFRFLVQTQWSNEVSSLALKDLAEKKWNKPVMLPLTKDIIKFRDHILDTANKNVALLKKDNNDVKAFKKLVDASLAFSILFNRRRIGDVQYVEIDSYLSDFTASNQTEILNQLTESEKTLTSNYKRVVAGGKGSRAIVILFPPIVQEYINLLLEIRKNSNIVPEQNRYLFAYPGVAKQWVRGDVVLKKFAKSCKIENPDAMTSNRLRKQIATLMQIMNLDKNDYSQFAKFMGHTEKTHQEFYEITQDAYQTAKVAKLLSLFDQGKGVEYRNKELSNIDIDPNSLIAESDYESENGNDPTGPSTEKTDNEGTQYTLVPQNVPKMEPRSKRVRWTQEQKNLVKSHFRNHIKNKKAPRKDECVKFISQHKDALSNLDWVRIKTFVYNEYTTKK